MLVWKLCLQVPTSVCCDMQCEHCTDISRKHSMEILFVSASICIFVRREWTETICHLHRSDQKTLSKLDRVLIVPGDNCMSYVNVGPYKVLTKILVIARSFPMSGMFMIRNNTYASLATFSIIKF